MTCLHIPKIQVDKKEKTSVEWNFMGFQFLNGNFRTKY